MYLLYVSLIIMIVIALAIILFPFIINKKIASLKFFSIILLFLFGTAGLYLYFNNLKQIKTWQTTGKEHYKLLSDVDKLGGIQKIILSIQQRLKDNPSDIRGWIILGKIFISLHRFDQAKQALNKAQQIEPDNLEVKQIKASIAKNQ